MLEVRRRQVPGRPVGGDSTGWPLPRGTPHDMLLNMTRRTSIEVDDALLKEAQRILGTVGVRDTVEAAWRELLRLEQLGQLADDLASGRLLDADPQLVADARRS